MITENMGVITVEDGNIVFKNFTTSGVAFYRRDNGDILLRIVTEELGESILKGCYEMLDNC